MVKPRLQIEEYVIDPSTKSVRLKVCDSVHHTNFCTTKSEVASLFGRKIAKFTVVDIIKYTFERLGNVKMLIIYEIEIDSAVVQPFTKIGNTVALPKSLTVPMEYRPIASQRVASQSLSQLQSAELNELGENIRLIAKVGAVFPIRCRCVDPGELGHFSKSEGMESANLNIILRDKSGQITLNAYDDFARTLNAIVQVSICLFFWFQYGSLFYLIVLFDCLFNILSIINTIVLFFQKDKVYDVSGATALVRGKYATAAHRFMLKMVTGTIVKEYLGDFDDTDAIDDESFIELEQVT